MSDNTRLQRQFTLAELAELLEVECVGDSETVISGLATLASAGPGQLSFLANPKYQQALETTSAAAVILAPDMVEACPGFCLVSKKCPANGIFQQCNILIQGRTCRYNQCRSSG